MSDAWNIERRRVSRSFDAVADAYREMFAEELEGKPFDRELLDRVASDLPAGPVIEVGAGPGQIGKYLADRGIPMIETDSSVGQLREARVLHARAPLVVSDLAALPTRPNSLAGILAFYCLIYGPPGPLDAVFASWHAALMPRGLVVIAVHSGDGSRSAREWRGRTIDLTVVERDPVALRRQVEAAGFGITAHVVRDPYDGEETERCYIIAER
jgi:SAM-dependent methyltransferase